MATFLITFRETLEAALVVGIVLSYLSKLQQADWFRTVWYAVFSGVALSIVAGILFELYFGGFQGRAEELYEGFIMLIAAALLTWMILWMLRQRHLISAHIQSQVDRHLAKGEKIGVFFLVLIAVLREGIETVLFLKASSLQAQEGNSLMAILGITIAVFLGYLLFSGLKKFSLKKFFTVTTVLLILFAAGLVAHSVHELQEAGVLPGGGLVAWDLNPSVPESGAYPWLHEKGTLGSLAKGIFGWNGNPTVLEVISYLVYMLFVLSMAHSIKRI